MDEFCISLTGIQNQEKVREIDEDQLKKKIEKLGGRFSSDFTNHVNVLIATKSGTLKYKVSLS
jgi:hypothetical protein